MLPPERSFFFSPERHLGPCTLLKYLETTIMFTEANINVEQTQKPLLNLQLSYLITLKMANTNKLSLDG